MLFTQFFSKKVPVKQILPRVLLLKYLASELQQAAKDDSLLQLRVIKNNNSNILFVSALFTRPYFFFSLHLFFLSLQPLLLYFISISPSLSSLSLSLSLSILPLTTALLPRGSFFCSRLTLVLRSATAWACSGGRDCLWCSGFVGYLNRVASC